MSADVHADVPGRELSLPAWGRFATAGVAIALVGAASIWTAAVARPSPLTHSVGLFVHLGALVLGFGAVLVVDWVAFLWVIGRRQLSDVLETARTTAVPIWGGYAGLVFSGLVLEPDLASPVTRVKLAAVLVIGLNGVFAAWLHAALQRNGESARLLVLGAFPAMVSQACWWGATVVGFASAH